MKRKTNLFYTTGESSKYLTFSNYTESLTGNFLSVDTKIFPSKFLCLNIEGLKAENKHLLIKYLVAYYENKMAALRDDCINQNVNYEKKLCPLSYLLEGLMKIKSLPDSGTQEMEYIDDDGEYIDPIFNITYIGDITEQDYNGTYSDTICIVSMYDMYKGEIQCSTKPKDPNTYIAIDDETLYGWNADELNAEYENVNSIYDKIGVINDVNVNQYSYDTYCKSINIVKNTDDKLKFNCIIPLYDVVNINYKTNENYIEYTNIVDDNTEGENVETESINLEYDDSNDSNIPAIHNVPLGIWFADKPVKLKKEVSTGYYPSWSLVISQQFKPFPYSKNYQYNLKSTNADAFNTFAIILSRQNDMINSFNKINDQLANIQSQINHINSQLSTVGTQQNIDALNTDIIKYKQQMSKELEDYKRQIDIYFNNLKWHSAI